MKPYMKQTLSEGETQTC